MLQFSESRHETHDRSGTRSLKQALFCVLAVVSLTVTLPRSEGLRIVPLVRDDRVLVTFELADGFTEEVRAAIRSGLKTTFTYTVDLRLEVPAWVDRTIATAVVTNSVEYDNLTRQHTVVRVLDGKVDETARVTDSEALVRQLMTSFQRLPLFRTSVLEPNREYYVRITADRASDQRRVPVAVGQRHVRPGQVHLHPLNVPDRRTDVPVRRDGRINTESVERARQHRRDLRRALVLYFVAFPVSIQTGRP